MDLDIAVKVIISIVVLGVVAAVGIRILTGVYTNTKSGMQQGANGSIVNLSGHAISALGQINDSISGVGTVTSWLPLIALVFVAVIILGAVFIIRRVSAAQ